MLPIPKPLTVNDIIEQRVAVTPQLPVFSVPGSGGWRPISWERFGHDVWTAGQGFLERGIGPGERVALLARPRYEWEVADKALMSIGAVSVGLDARTPTAELKRIFQAASIQAAVVEDAGILARLPDAFLTQARLVVLMEPAEQAQAPCPLATVKELMSGPGRSTPPRVRVAPSDPAVVVYTSGTTGAPKGIPFDHSQLVVGVPIMARVFAKQLALDQVTISWLPLHNATGRYLSLVSMYLGIRQCLVSDPTTILQALREVNPTFLFAVPRFYEKIHAGIQARLQAAPRPWRGLVGLAQALVAARVPLLGGLADRLLLHRIRTSVFGSRIQFVFTGSAPISRDILDFFESLGLQVLEAYGCSENISLIGLNQPHKHRPGSVGPLLEVTQMKLADDGEVLVRGPSLFRGYLEGGGDIDQDGWYHTGDVARMDGEFLVLVGRKKEIFKTSTGQRISPQEVEKVYQGSSYLDQVVAVGSRRKYLTLLVTMSEENVRSWLSARGVPAPEHQTLHRLAEVQRLVAREIEARHHLLAPYKRAAGYTILPRPFTVEGGELSRALKLRRNVVEAKYGQLVDRMYAEEA